VKPNPQLRDLVSSHLWTACLRRPIEWVLPIPHLRILWNTKAAYPRTPVFPAGVVYFPHLRILHQTNG